MNEQTTMPETILQLPLKDALQAAHRLYFIEAYERAARNQTVTAELLGISVRTVARRVKQYGLPANAPGTGRRNQTKPFEESREI